ncbi:glycosyltransferase family 2 protein [Polynucleobacter brandtiae]|uniref:Glycosyl transferase family 2 n=1 Tax=Polynucleobacter brandtiae TaxID=1938816 RepID=A0A2M8VJI4_9BURK|nr:glycosyltransferase family 2 protein [Polynucleobacter brandtiae]PJI77163.1 glycosyl transferase family 2 [Polynucleobacter brandtiae]
MTALKYKIDNEEQIIYKPFVSIITATYNTERSLGKTIESLRNQNFKDFEWIVIDGGSNDLTLEIIKENSDIVANWISEPDSGIYDAWNKGLGLARGEWIAFLGAGDCYFPEALQIYVNVIHTGDSESELITSKIQLVDDKGKSLREVGSEFDFERHKKVMTIAHVGAFHKKSLFEKFGKFNLAYSSAGDYEYLMRCGANLRTSHINSVTASMLVGGASGTYGAILEAYRIQKDYGSPILIAIVRACIALVKNNLRPYIRGY